MVKGVLTHYTSNPSHSGPLLHAINVDGPESRCQPGYSETRERSDIAVRPPRFFMYVPRYVPLKVPPLITGLVQSMARPVKQTQKVDGGLLLFLVSLQHIASGQLSRGKVKVGHHCNVIGLGGRNKSPGPICVSAVLLPQTVTSLSDHPGFYSEGSSHAGFPRFGLTVFSNPRRRSRRVYLGNVGCK